MSKALADKFREYAKGRVVFSGKSGKSNAELRGFNKAVYLLEQMPEEDKTAYWIGSPGSSLVVCCSHCGHADLEKTDYCSGCGYKIIGTKVVK